jgi:HEAT repeat protein
MVNDTSLPDPASGSRALQEAKHALHAALSYPDAMDRLETLKQIIEQFNTDALVEELLLFLADPDPLVRCEAVEALEEAARPEVHLHLAGLAIADPDWLVRGWALGGLKDAPYTWVNSFLWTVYRRDRSHFVKISALGTLLYRGVQEAYPLLVEYLFSAHYRFVIQTANALAHAIEQLSPDTLASLREIIQERLQAWRSAAAVVEALENCLSDIDARLGESVR